MIEEIRPRKSNDREPVLRTLDHAVQLANFPCSYHAAIDPLTCFTNASTPAGEGICSFAIITTQPNELCAESHNRMPAVLKPEMWLAWLSEQPATVQDLKAMLAPYPAEDMIC